MCESVRRGLVYMLVHVCIKVNRGSQFGHDGQCQTVSCSVVCLCAWQALSYSEQFAEELVSPWRHMPLFGHRTEAVQTMVIDGQAQPIGQSVTINENTTRQFHLGFIHPLAWHDTHLALLDVSLTPKIHVELSLLEPSFRKHEN